MSEQTTLYVSVEGRAGHLVISGPLVLFRELVGSFGVADQLADDATNAAGDPAEDGSDAADDVQPVGAAR